MTLTMGDLVKRSGISAETVRFYEREGLLPEPPRSQGGHRRYMAGDVERLQFIQRAKQLGFSLREVQELLRLADSPDATCAEVCAVSNKCLADIEEKIASLTRMRDALPALTRRCPSSDASVEKCTIIGALRAEKSCCDMAGGCGASKNEE